MKKRVIFPVLLIFGVLDRIFTYLIVQKLGTEGELWIVLRILMEKVGIVEGLTISFIFLVFVAFFCYKFWWFRYARILAYLCVSITVIVTCYNLFGLFCLNIL